MEASVEPANLAEKGVWYRVRLGPFTRIDEINRLRQQLAQNGVEASLVRIKDVATN
jgi:cell division protein FtsN